MGGRRRRLISTFAIASLWTACNSSWAAEAVDQTFPLERVDTIDIETAAGAILVNAVESKVVKVAAPATGEECTMTQSSEGGVLHLVARGRTRRSFALDAACAAGYTISAPPGLRIKARSVAGDISIGAFTGGTDAQTGTGNIALNETRGDIAVHAGRGSIQGTAPGDRIGAIAQHGSIALRDLRGNASIRSGDGGVTLSWSSLPMRGVIDVRTAGGAQRIEVPSTARMALRMRTDSGTTASEAADDPRSDLQVVLRSTSGAIVVKKTSLR